MCFKIIVPWMLRTSFGDKSSFEFRDVAFFVAFLGKDLFIGYRDGACRFVDQLPGAHLL